MSLTKRAVVVCDRTGCGAEFAGEGGHAREAYAAARAAGWTQVRNASGTVRDLCPKCTDDLFGATE